MFYCNDCNDSNGILFEDRSKCFFIVDTIFLGISPLATSLAFLLITLPFESLLYLNTRLDEIIFDPEGTVLTTVNTFSLSILSSSSFTDFNHSDLSFSLNMSL